MGLKYRLRIVPFTFTSTTNVFGRFILFESLAIAKKKAKAVYCGAENYYVSMHGGNCYNEIASGT